MALLLDEKSHGALAHRALNCLEQVPRHGRLINFHSSLEEILVRAQRAMETHHSTSPLRLQPPNEVPTPSAAVPGLRPQSIPAGQQAFEFPLIPDMPINQELMEELERFPMEITEASLPFLEWASNLPDVEWDQHVF